MGTDYTLDTAADSSPAQFDLSSYLSQTATSAAERIQWQLQAKEAQIKSRIELYEQQKSSLQNEIQQLKDNVEKLQNQMWRTDDEEQQVKQVQRRLERELRDLQQQAAQELQKLEDERITLQAELDAYQDGQELTALAERWLQ